MNLDNELLEDRYQILKAIGKGSFAQVYQARDLITNKKVAVKAEIHHNSKVFLNEVQAYTALSSIKGIPNLFATGDFKGTRYLIIELFKDTLARKLANSKKRFSLPCSILIAQQILTLLEAIHDNNYIHRDLKPDNIMLARKKNQHQRRLYLIDFGLSKLFKDPLTKQHSLYGENRQMIGNLKYSSLNSNLGIEQSRRDDLESLFYMIICFIKRKLPWDSKKTQGSKAFVVSIKSSVSINKICEDCPVQFFEILSYIKVIKFDERPNYEYISELLNNVIKEQSIIPKFDWIIKKKRLSNDLLKVDQLEHKEKRRGSALISIPDSLIITRRRRRENSSKHLKISSRGKSSNSSKSDSYRSDLLSDSEEKKSSEFKDSKELGIPIISRKDTLKTNEYPEFQHRELIFPKKKP